MNESIQKRKCGQIFILSHGKFSFVCEICGNDYFSLDDFGLHITGHFPKSLMNIIEKDPPNLAPNCVQIECTPLETFDVQEEKLIDIAATERLDDNQCSTGAIEQIEYSNSMLITGPVDQDEQQPLRNEAAINLKVKITLNFLF